MKEKYLDLAVAVLYIVALVVISFFWGCHLDLYVTVLGAVILVATGAVRVIQNKKLKELTGEGK